MININLEAERIVLGALLNDINNIEIIKEDGSNLFQHPNNKNIYNAILDLYNNKNHITIESVIHHLRNKNLDPQVSILTEIEFNYIESHLNSSIKTLKDINKKVELIKFKGNMSPNDDLDETIRQLETIKNNSSTFSFEDSKNLLESFLEEINYIYKSGGRKYISTGFVELDEKIGGGLYSGLYVVGAGSSIGKTTFVQQIVDSIGSNGTKVLFFSLEMSKKEMISKTITRELYLKNTKSKLGTRQLLNGDLTKEDWKALNNYSNNVNKNISNMFYLEGNFATTVDDIVNKCKMFKSIYKETPVIVVDYLQIIRPIDIRMGEKQAVDYNIAELKRLSRDLDTPVIVISSINRQNYLSYIDFSSFKESGSIEYSADVVIGLQLTAIHEISELKDSKVNEKRELYNRAKAADPRQIELVILKNRNGISTGTHQYEYYPKYNLFKEIWWNKQEESKEDLFCV